MNPRSPKKWTIYEAAKNSQKQPKSGYFFLAKESGLWYRSLSQQNFSWVEVASNVFGF